MNSHFDPMPDPYRKPGPTPARRPPDDLRVQCETVLAMKLPEHAVAALPAVIRLVEEDTAERIAAWLHDCGLRHAAEQLRSGAWKEQP